MQEPEIKNLLKKYIHNQCSPGELAFVLNYIQLPEGKAALEDLLLNEWNTFEPDKGNPGQAELWYERFNARIKDQTISSFIASYAWLKYAAILVLVTSFGAWLLLNGLRSKTALQITMAEKFNPRGQRSRIALQDGSIVYLGADSRLRYPELLDGKTREVFLEGEAFFEVKHDMKNPFIVHTGNVETQVLGTSFKIEAFKDQRLTIAVATGKVSVGYKEDNNARRSLAVLTPGREVSWNADNNKAEITAVATEDIKGWRNGSLAFTDRRLDDICRELERWYNVKIIIKKDKPKAYSLSTNINGNAPITLALDAITAATGLKYSISQNQITLSGK